MTNKFTLLIFTLLALSSCSSNDDKTESTTDTSANYALITRPQNADGRSFAAYMQKMDSPDVTGTINNANAHEISASHSGGVYEFKKAVYVNDYQNGLITRWTLSNGNLGQKTGSISVPELGFQGNISFKDENTAYIGGSGKIVIFNPTTMVKTGVIDCSSLSRVGKVTNFPTAGATIKAEGVTEIIINGNFMYAALYAMYDFNTFTPATTTCDILVIDLTKVNNSAAGNSAALVKVITDDRGSFTGAWNTGGGVYYMNRTENGDIYVLCHNVFGGARSAIGKPACLLRIKSGATAFDTNYYFDLETVSQGNGNPVTNFEYYGNGKFLATVLDPTKLDPNNPYSYNTDPVFRWWSFDLNAKTAKKLDDEYTNSGKVARCYFANGYAYVPFANKTTNYINKINLNDFSKTKAVTTTGISHILGLK
ncbi:DUF4374 domain-containing protein [Flavobacterium sp. Fl-318]|uniref:DUF4374 domain-containing protein n=1 Tax=Flavobacterium cupriresistens TaxID=2893885 RepID=A0ABU4RAU2_9FLAO|nr:MULTISPECIES: DUF4374 domain-containing protein [unclassified Flavobacterium]MDX6189694.1 DUF4374 domain-containing protein [Flavobacterium sp. Fl-318]UFH40900.1 DUF4374 domain-containing protein [Flavobacterium sp. F-323]